MAPTEKDAKADQNQPSNVDREHDPDGEQDGGTQDTGTVDIYSLAVKSMKSVSAISASLPQDRPLTIRKSEIRRENRRQKIRLDYINTMNEIEDDITTTFQKESKRMSMAYKAKARHLAMLLKKRALVEKNIADSIERLETAYIQANNELQLTVAGRIRAAAEQDSDADKSKVAE